MPLAALADALPDFGAGAPAPAERKPAADEAFGTLRESAPPPAPAAAAERRPTIEEIVAKAEAALAERLEREHEEKLAAERERHAAEMEAAVSRLGEEAGAAIAARFTEMQREVATLTGALTAHILGAVLTEDLQKRAVNELARIVEAALDDREAVRIRIRGTTLLCNALKGKLGERAQQVSFTEAPGFDLTAEIDESLFETRLAEWSEALAEVLS
ncbi:hypothetical protein [Chelativorans salis]|uniref:Flagellar assembly protein FliH/Type III secretion system HrpE domain-containing protein n=1 Tax=Chelativorans salis TaxID=2978478 RepID=A0ABT2LW12_9HYPH|nr:hypothetical protein [Chelativorans sp. EGI FJ00035]MCT7377568.1 hypothetical protein [Chelativorans sp. EGI FJ00035]